MTSSYRTLTLVIRKYRLVIPLRKVCPKAVCMPQPLLVIKSSGGGGGVALHCMLYRTTETTVHDNREVACFKSTITKK